MQDMLPLDDMDSLLEEIRQQQADLDDEVEELLRLVTREARSSMESTHSCTPMVAAIVGMRRQLFLPNWRSEWERQQVYEELEEKLEENNASATISAFSGEYRGQPSLMIATLTPSWKQLRITPYQIDPSGNIHWGITHTTSDFDPPAVSVPCVN